MILGVLYESRVGGTQFNQFSFRIFVYASAIILQVLGVCHNEDAITIGGSVSCMLNSAIAEDVVIVCQYEVMLEPTLRERTPVR